MNKIFAILRDRPIIIWGARMTGIGFLRFAKLHNKNVIAFIDSDSALHNTKISNIPVHHPDCIPALKNKHKNLLVVIAVSTKEDEISSLLQKYKISNITYNDYSKNFFTIDISGTCNLKCPSCANSVSPNRPKNFMSLSDFKLITDKILSETDIVSHFCLYSWGEPMLHPHLNQFINYAHSKGIATAISTNLSINSDTDIQSLVKSSPDTLKISLSGYYPEIYNIAHVGGNINLVKSNLYKLRYYMDKHKISFPVEINYHLYKYNLSDLPLMQNLCNELNFTLSTTYSVIAPVERILDYCNGKIDTKTKKVNDSLLVDIPTALKISEPFKNLPCRYLSNQININYDRSVSLCCLSNLETTIICKDFLKTPISEINASKLNHDICKQCTSHAIHQYYLTPNKPEWDKVACL